MRTVGCTGSRRASNKLLIYALFLAALFFLGGAARSSRLSGASPPKDKASFTGRIVFEHAPDSSAPWPTLDIYSVNADGTQLQELTIDGHSHDPSWSPDGRHILYIHDNFWPEMPPGYVHPPYASHFPIELYVMDSDGGNAHFLRRFDGPISAAAWSPDGKSLAIHCIRQFGRGEPGTGGKPGSGLYLIPVDGQGEVGPVFSPTATNPAWSPDGRKLAFSVYADATGSTIAVGDADGSHQFQLLNPVLYIASPYPQAHEDAESPAWSPDGSQIAFGGFPMTLTNNTGPLYGGGRQQQIFLMSADGSGRRQLTTDDEWQCAHPTWSPDGTEIAFSCRSTWEPCTGGGFNGEGKGIGPGPWEGSAPKLPGPGCVRRVFVLHINDPTAKPVQITQHDGANPVFAPAP